MKLLTTVTAIVSLLALAGCESKEARQKAEALKKLTQPYTETIPMIVPKNQERAPGTPAK